TDGSSATGFVTEPSGVAGWNGPYIQKWPAVNAFGGTYTYHCNAPVAGAGITTADRYITVTGISDTGIIKLKNDIDSTTLSAISVPQTTGSVRYVDNSKIYIILSASADTSATSSAFTGGQTPSTSNLLLNGDFSDGTNHWVTVPDSASGGNASGSVVSGQHKVAITNAGSLNYSVQLCQGGFGLTGGKTYRLTFDASSTVDRTIQLDINMNLPPFSSYASKSINIDGTMKSYSYDFVMSTNDNNCLLSICLGGPQALPQHDVYFDNMVLEEITCSSTSTPSAVNILANGDFTDGGSYWTTVPDSTSGGSATGSGTGGEYKVAITNIGSLTYSVQLCQGGLKLTGGKVYRLTFDARSTVDRTIQLHILNSSNYSSYASTPVNIDGTMKSYSFDFGMSTTDNNSILAIHLGATEALSAHDVYFDNMVLKEVSNGSTTAQSFLNNSDFNYGTSYWDTIVTPPANATYSIVNGEYKASITDVGNACYYVQLMQHLGAPLTAGKTYRISIDARSTINRSIELIIQNSSNYAYYYDQVIDIDGTMRTYTIDLPMSTSLSNITLVAGMGAVNGATGLPAHDVYIDNLKITEQ
ncbi:MAG TPA: carbohydrate binding domain-containing protein, partial [Clostridia bacterium]